MENFCCGTPESGVEAGEKKCYSRYAKRQGRRYRGRSELTMSDTDVFGSRPTRLRLPRCTRSQGRISYTKNQNDCPKICVGHKLVRRSDKWLTAESVYSLLNFIRRSFRWLILGCIDAEACLKRPKVLYVTPKMPVRNARWSQNRAALRKIAILHAIK